MIWFFVVFGTVGVAAVGLWLIGRTVRQLEGQALPALLDVEDATNWVAERLPVEVSGALSYDDVRRVIGWELDFLQQAGMTSEFGEDLAGDAVQADVDPVAQLDAAADRAVQHGINQEPPLDAVHVMVVCDRLASYLEQVGAVGGQVVEPGSDASTP